MKPWRLFDEASAIRAKRIRPIPFPSSWAAIMTKALAFAATTTRTFGNSTQKRFIHLHFALQPITPWPNHGPPEFRQQSPSGLIASQAQHPLQSQSARAILLTPSHPTGPEPNSPWFVGVLKNRPCRYRSLVTTVSADPSVTLRRPCRFCVAARTIETIRPTQFKQVFTTGCLGREFGFKIQNRRGNSSATPIHYWLWQVESTGYPHNRIGRRYSLDSHLAANWSCTHNSDHH